MDGLMDDNCVFIPLIILPNSLIPRLNSSERGLGTRLRGIPTCSMNPETQVTGTRGHFNKVDFVVICMHKCTVNLVHNIVLCLVKGN